MSPRVSKPAETQAIPKTIEEASALVALIGAKQRELQAIQSGLEDKLKKLMDDAEAEAAAIEADIHRKTVAVETWATINRKALTKGGKAKSFKLPAGTVGWQAGKAKLVVDGGRKGAEVAVAHCEKEGLVTFLTFKASLNRTALLAAGADKLKGIPNVSIQPGGAETFFVKPLDLPVTADVTLPKG